MDLSDDPAKTDSILSKNGIAQPRSVAQWEDVFAKIYQSVDSGRSPLEMWVAATSHFSSVGEAIRRMDFDDLMHYASHAFCWMCSFVLACQRAKGTVYELNQSFSDLVACQYPLVCKHCIQKPCSCNPQAMDMKKDKAGRYRQLLLERSNIGVAPKDYDIPRWLQIFNGIYGQHIHMLTLDSIGFHFLEEAGEELTALRQLVQLDNILEAKIDGIDEAFLSNLTTFEKIMEHNKDYVGLKPPPSKSTPEEIKARLVNAKIDMISEFGDTFSWFCSILNKVESIASNCKDGNCVFTKNAFQGKLLKEYFPNDKIGCPTCKKFPCACFFFGKPWVHSPIKDKDAKSG